MIIWRLGPNLPLNHNRTKTLKMNISRSKTGAICVASSKHFSILYWKLGRFNNVRFESNRKQNENNRITWFFFFRKKMFDIFGNVTIVATILITFKWFSLIFFI